MNSPSPANVAPAWRPLLFPLVCLALGTLLLLIAGSVRSGAHELLASAANAQAELNALAPDLQAARGYRARVASLREELARAHASGEQAPATPKELFDSAQAAAAAADPSAPKFPSSESVSDRFLTTAGFSLRTTELYLPSTTPVELSQGILAATAAGHQLTSVELDPVPPPAQARLRARLTFYTLH